MNFPKEKSNQKLIYSRDTALNPTGDMSIVGIFKSTSALAQSIKKQSEKNKTDNRFGSYAMSGSINSSMNTTGGTFKENKNSILSSARLIMTPNTNNQHEELQKTNKMNSVKHGVNPSTAIRNLTHFYDKAEPDERSYELISALMAEKRMDHLDSIDDYEVWKINYIKTIEDRIKRKIDSLKDHLNKTKHEINSQFTKTNDEMINLMWSDITKIEITYNQIILKRNDEILNIKGHIVSQDAECMKTVENYISNLQKLLIDIGFKLDYECEKLANEKYKEKEIYFKSKEEAYEKLFTSITEGERNLAEESKVNLKNFLLRWKNIKFNKIIQDLKNKLNSDEFLDNPERYEFIQFLKQDQEDIYSKRVNLIIEKLFKLPLDEISSKKTEIVNKELEDIYNNAQNIFDNHTRKLVENSENIYQKSLIQVDKFKSRFRSLHYEFGEDLDNFNEKKYNDYESLNNLDELIDSEISPILNGSKNDRKEFISKIITYLDEYDDYTHNNCVKLLNLVTSIGTKNDDHQKLLVNNEKNYQLDIAKAADNDEDIVFQKEENLKAVINQMKESIDKIELDKSLDDAFKVMDELEVEYRDFFKIIENLLNSHEGRLVDTFHNYEAKILSIFGIVGKEKMEEIMTRRNAESNFLSKVKEAEIAFEENKEAENDKNNPNAKKGAAVKKKAQAPVKGKKGEVNENFIASRHINEIKSKLKFDYLIDFTISELVKNNLRNIIYSREDDNLGINTPGISIANNSNNELNSTFYSNPDGAKKDLDIGKNQKGNNNILNRPVSKNINPIPTTTIQVNKPEINHLKLFNPYSASTHKEFASPLSMKQIKLLSEENIFNENFLVNLLEKLYNSLCDKIVLDLQKLIDSNKILDNEHREEVLSELDIRLKSLAPRKGKVEVEEYDKRMNEIEIHMDKLNHLLKSITERNTKDAFENKILVEELTNSYNEFNSLFEILFKGIEEEQFMKGLDDKNKKFKTSYYDLTSKVSEIEIKLKNYSTTNPENLININKNFILSLKTFKEKGTYSDRELEFYKGKMDTLNKETLVKEKNERETENKNKILSIRTNMIGLLEKIDKRYIITVENIMAKDVIGKKFGGPKRIANDIIINMKMKCNQAQEGLGILLKGLKEYIEIFNKKKLNDEYILNNSLSLNIRSQILKINNCVFQYGKYIDAFKSGFSSGYSLVRVNMKDGAEIIEIIAKDELEEDEKRKINELTSLGFLSKFITMGNDNPKDTKDKKGDKESNANYINELNSIEDKVKTECGKIYTGEYAKIINNVSKLPESLVPFLQNVKIDMENFRLKCVRELRTYCQNLFEFSLSIPATLLEFIFIQTLFSKTITYESLHKEFYIYNSQSESIKKEQNSQLGPYLANPYYQSNLLQIEQKEMERHKMISGQIDKKQYELIENEEKFACEFSKRIINNFEIMIALFDNFIFEEEFISLGDEEYFKERRDYNFLLKLKSENKANINLDSKRTFKKIYGGVDKNKLKINFYERFKKFAVNYTQNNEEKIKILETENKKENFSKNVTGLKLQNNKNLFRERNIFYEKYCDNFKSDMDRIIANFDNFRDEELKYDKRWYELITGLKGNK